MNDFIFRPALAGDLEALVDFNARLAMETEHRVLHLDLLRPGVAAVLADAGKGSYFVAENREEVVGQLLLTFEWSDWRNGRFWWIQSVYVKSEFRGRGALRGLFGHVRDLARLEKNVCGLRLYVEKENLTAQQAYEKLGLTRTPYEVFEADFVYGTAAP